MFSRFTLFISCNYLNWHACDVAYNCNKLQLRHINYTHKLSRMMVHALALLFFLVHLKILNIALLDYYEMYPLINGSFCESAFSFKGIFVMTLHHQNDYIFEIRFTSISAKAKWTPHSFIVNRKMICVVSDSCGFSYAQFK